MGTSYADDILSKLEEFQRHGHVIFDKAANSLQQSYTPQEAQRDRERLLENLCEIERLLKSGLLFHLDLKDATDTAISLQEKIEKTNVQLRETNAQKDKLHRNANSFRTRFSINNS